jgi:hypothetical protein
MKYIVSGYRRTGTSMMMRALSKGSGAGFHITRRIYTKKLRVLASNESEESNQEVNGYRPNPNGLFEVSHGRYLNALYLRKLPHGCLIKIFFDGLIALPHSQYKIIFMTRNHREIEASLNRIKQYKEDQYDAGPSWEEVTKDWPPKAKEYAELLEERVSRVMPFDRSRPYNQYDIDHVLGICEAREDIDLIKVNYNDVIDDPEREFRRLASWGIPINPETSASTVDKKLYRSRS